MSSIRNRFNDSWETTWQRQLDRLDRQEAKRADKLPRWRTRWHRRRLTLLLLLGILLMITAAAIMLPDTPLVAFAVLWFGGFVLVMTALGVLRILTGKMTSAFSALLDEREREWRHRATHIGFQALSCLMGAAVFYILIIQDQPDAAIRGAMMTGALLGLGASVPTVVLGWTLPDDDPADSDEALPHDEKQNYEREDSRA